MKIAFDGKKRFLLFLFSACLLGCVLKLLTLPEGFSVDAERAVDLYPDMTYSAYGLEVSGNEFTPTNNDPQIAFSIVPQWISSITVTLDSPLPQDTNVQVFYAVGGGYFSEKNSVKDVFAKGKTEYTLRMPAGKYAHIRLDINGRIELKKITINDYPALIYVKYLRAAMLLALITAAAFFFFGKVRIERLYLVCSVSLGLLYLLTLAPLSVPDENHHYQSAYELSNTLLFRLDQKEEGNAADFDYTGLTLHWNTLEAYDRVARSAPLPAEAGETVSIPGPRDLSYFPMYLPQALGIAFARCVNANFIWIFWTGRLFNLLFYVLCTWLAIRIAPRFKPLLFLVAVSPMSLHQAASFSYDSFTLALSLLLIALLLKAILAEGVWKKGAFFLTIAVAALLSPAKVVYYPITFLALLIPQSRFLSKKDRIFRVAAVILLPLLFLLVYRFFALVSTATDTGQWLNHEGEHNYTFSFILRNPVDTVEIFLDTLSENIVYWLKCAQGYNLSGLSLMIPEWIPFVYIALLTLSSLHREQDPACLSVRVRWAFGAVSLVIGGLIMLSMFLGWTSDTRTIIIGVQGRYFIPILPLLFLTLNNNTLCLKRNMDKALLMASFLMNIGTLHYIIEYTLTH